MGHFVVASSEVRLSARRALVFAAELPVCPNKGASPEVCALSCRKISGENPIAAFGHALNRGALGVVRQSISARPSAACETVPIVIQSTSPLPRALPADRPMIQQRLLCFQRQFVIASTSPIPRLGGWLRFVGYGHHIQPSLTRGLFDFAGCPLLFFCTHSSHTALRDPDAGEQVSWNEQRVGPWQVRSKAPASLMTRAMRKTSLASLFVVSSRRNDFDAQVA